jgi:hypothetical protein
VTKKEIVKGAFYVAKVGMTLTVVRVDDIRTMSLSSRDATRYDVTNLRTGRRTTFKAAGKFRRLASTVEAADGRVRAHPLNRAQKNPVVPGPESGQP